MSEVERQPFTAGGKPSDGLLGPDAKTSAVGLRIRIGISREQWAEMGRRIVGIGNAYQWWLAEWMIFGDSNFENAYEDAERITGLERQTLYNIASVAGRIDYFRIRRTLSFKHHSVVAPLDDEEQDTWLARAEAEGLSTIALQDAIREERGGQAPRQLKAAGVTVRITAAPDHEQRWRRAAEVRGQALESWVVSVLDEAAGRELEELAA